MRTSSNQKAFLEHIRAKPTDSALRLIFGDWLEEQGMVPEAELQRCLGRVLAKPRSAHLRARYSQCLFEAGKEAEGNHQFMLSNLARGDVPSFATEGATEIFTREGLRGQEDPYKAKKPLADRRKWKKRAAELFAAHPDVFFMIVRSHPPDKQWFRIGDRKDDPVESPCLLLYYNKETATAARCRFEGCKDPEEDMGGSCPFCCFAEVCPHYLTHSPYPELDDSLGGRSSGYSGIFVDSVGPLEERLEKATLAFLNSGAGRTRRILIDASRPLGQLIATMPRDEKKKAEMFEDDSSISPIPDYVLQVCRELDSTVQVVEGTSDSHASDEWLQYYCYNAIRTTHAVKARIAADIALLKKATAERSSKQK